MLGNLVSKFGLSEGLALSVVGILSNAGINAVTALYPFLIPAVRR